MARLFKDNQVIDSNEPVRRLCVHLYDFYVVALPHAENLCRDTLSWACTKFRDATDSVRRNDSVAAGGDERTNCSVAHVSSKSCHWHFERAHAQFRRLAVLPHAVGYKSDGTRVTGR